MNNYSLIAENITQIFGRRLIFKDINFTFNSGNVYGLSGHNGSGKSTLTKIIAGLLAPTKGKIIHKKNDVEIKETELHNHIGFVSPYLVLYDEFSAEENLVHFSKIRGLEFNKEKSDNLFNHFGLFDRRKEFLKGYSSGMKQRVKFIFALLHEPELLLLDEPTSNLDNEGKDRVYETINKLSSEKLIIIASNEDSDLNLCSDILSVENYKKVE